MKISYVNSICVRNDAISNAIRDEFAFLRNAGHDDIRLFAFNCDDAALPFTQCNSVSDIVRDRHFLDSDIVIFHFGIFYTLFNLFPMIPKRARKLVVFHNITPAPLVPPKDQWLIEKSFQQIDNIHWADHVICDSNTNLEVLRSLGLTTPASVVPLTVRSALQPPAGKPSFEDGMIRIAFVGRFTRSKGPLELLSAIESTLADPGWEAKVQIDFIGNLAFSDSLIVARMRQQIEELSRRFDGTFHADLRGDASDEVKHAVLRDADIFALPTYHEGFCVPIIEAIASGCRVIAYENSNTPDISGNLASLVPTGNVEGLALALRHRIGEVRSENWRLARDANSYSTYAQDCVRHVSRFSPERVAPLFVTKVRQVAAK